jgi:hypothetical protein
MYWEDEDRKATRGIGCKVPCLQVEEEEEEQEEGHIMVCPSDGQLHDSRMSHESILPKPAAKYKS